MGKVESAMARESGWIFQGMALASDGWQEGPAERGAAGPGASSARRRPGYPLVGLRPRRARLRFTQPEKSNPNPQGGARPVCQEGAAGNGGRQVREVRAKSS
jgi:hypothetical protein